MPNRRYQIFAVSPVYCVGYCIAYLITKFTSVLNLT